MGTLVELAKDFEESKGDLVIFDFQVCKLLNLVTDDPYDYYWKYETWDGEVVCQSCVIGFTKLKNSLPDNDYDYLVGVWNLNHEKQIKGTQNK